MVYPRTSLGEGRPELVQQLRDVTGNLGFFYFPAPSYLVCWFSFHGHKVTATPLTITSMFPLNKGKEKGQPERSGREEDKVFSLS